MAVTIAAICDGIASTLSTATGITSVKSYDEVTESIPQNVCPRLQVYPDTVDPNPGDDTERQAFQLNMSMLKISIIVDHFARQRSHIDLDNKAVVDGLDAIIDVLQDQTRPPYFGVTQIKAFDWNWKRATLRYGDSWYAGSRFTIDVYIY